MLASARSGRLANLAWSHSTVELPPGALLLLYTDGVVDAQSPQQERFGNEQMLDAVRESFGRSAQDVQEDLLTRLQRFIGNEPQFDDITVMTVRRDL